MSEKISLDSSDIYYYITKILRKWFQLKVVCLHAEDYMLGYYLIFVPPNTSLISIWSRAVSI